METLPPSIATHIPLYGSRLLHDQGKSIEEKPGDHMKDLDVNFGHLGECFMDTTLRAAVSSRKRL